MPSGICPGLPARSEAIATSTKIFLSANAPRFARATRSFSRPNLSTPSTGMSSQDPTQGRPTARLAVVLVRSRILGKSNLLCATSSEARETAQLEKRKILLPCSGQEDFPSDANFSRSRQGIEFQIWDLESALSFIVASRRPSGVSLPSLAAT